MRALLLAVVFIGAVAVGGGQVLEARATDQVTAALTATTGSVEGVDVELAGLAIALRAATGRVPRAVVRIDELTTVEREVTFAPVVMDLQDLRFDPVAVALEERPTVTVGDGSVTAAMTAEQVSRLVAQQDGGWTVTLQDGQLVATGSVEGVSVRVVVEVAAAEGTLRLTASEVAVSEEIPAATVAEAFDRSLPMPELPGRIRLTEAEVRETGVILRARVRGALDLRS